MLKLSDNQFNVRRLRHEPKLKLWRYAGLMLTYRCSASCRFCYYHCTPQAGGLMSVDAAIGAWEGLVRLAGSHAKVHITGGEPFLYFDRLAEILKRASQLKLTPLDVIETNAGCWSDEAGLRDQLRLIDSYGLNRLKISWDAFHEEFIDAEKVRAFIRISRDILGQDRVLVRWEKHLASGEKSVPSDSSSVFLEAMKTDSCRFTGRAAQELAPLVAQYPPEFFCGRHCQKALLGSKGVHIDPFGNVFNGQCSGMILGNINHKPLDVLWREFEPDRTPFWDILYKKGPNGFLERAKENAYQQRDKYASKCHLCTDIRRFFFDKGVYSKIIGPCDCYGKT